MPVLIALVLLVVGVLAYRSYAKRSRRRALLSSALSGAERAVVAEAVPMTRRLPEALRGSLEGKMQLFLDQVDFIGCDGLEVTEEMRLSIAAQACMLVVNSEAWYQTLRTILIYPGAFRSHQAARDGYVVTERRTVRLGESWSRGPVILSWAHSEQGAADDRDGQNVVLHEFAHQLDDLSGRADGAPLMAKGQSFAEWARVFTGAYERHVEDVERGRRTLLDAYGAEGPEEFFAVAIEMFFEKAEKLRDEEPEIYRQISELLRLDPATWD